jgi:hypothetical protein
MFDHELPVAAIPVKSVVDLQSVVMDGAPFVVEVAAIHHGTPRAGLITWDTRNGPSFTLPANLRVPVNLPAAKERSEAGDSAPRRRRRP